MVATPKSAKHTQSRLIAKCQFVWLNLIGTRHVSIASFPSAPQTETPDCQRGAGVSACQDRK